MGKQLKFKIKSWGGKRKGAGRPNRSGQIAHVSRARVQGRYPVHITLRLKCSLVDLRTERMLREFREAIRAAREFGLNVNHFALLTNHIHMIVEATDNETLARGMKSFGSRFGKAIQRASGRQGPVFEGRYHLHVLKTPSEMRHALTYVLLNESKHRRVIPYIDGFSSGYAFQDWRKLVGRSPLVDRQLADTRGHTADYLAPPRSWLAREGWMLKK